MFIIDIIKTLKNLNPKDFKFAHKINLIESFMTTVSQSIE